MQPNLNLLESFDYSLPEELIAQTPLEPRDHSRLLVVDRRTGKITHQHFYDLPQWLDAADFLVVNNTRVMRARLKGRRILPSGEFGGEIEFLLHEEIEPLVWGGIMRSSARQQPGLKFAVFSHESFQSHERKDWSKRDHILVEGAKPAFYGELVSSSRDNEVGTVVARFSADPLLEGAGEIPLPPYIAPSSKYDDRYQTVYSQETRDARSAAAPTAGLHFTPELFQELEKKGVGRCDVSLNVGLGTFRPVRDSELSRHPMHSEAYFISDSSAHAIQTAKREGKRIVAVGTTSIRTLEASARDAAFGTVGAGQEKSTHLLKSGHSRTQIFIRPGETTEKFLVADRLLTNFHLPKSTLLMLVSAFMGPGNSGHELLIRAYQEAITEKYRFFSFGDAMLIL